MRATTIGSTIVAVLAALMISVGAGVAEVPAHARPAPPPPGSMVTMTIVNKTGWDLTLSGWPSTDRWGGSSSPTRWIDPPARVVPRGGIEVVRAWSANPGLMSASVTYTWNYRLAHHRYQSELVWALGFTTLGQTHASKDSYNIARITRFGPNSQATYTLR